MGEPWHHTTICAVRRDGVTALASDGQVTLGNTVVKHGATKLRRLGDGRVVAGFAGSVADALALFSGSRPSSRSSPGTSSAPRSSWPRDWRTDRALRHLEAMMIVADRERPPPAVRAPAR